MKTLLSALAIATTLAAIPRTSDAATIKFCIKIAGAFDDNNVGEDYWTDDLMKPAIGAWAQVRKGNPSGPIVWGPGYLGDLIGAGDPGLGCTTNFITTTPDDTYWILVGSWGQVEGHTIESWNGRFSSQGQWLTYVAQGSVTIADGGAQQIYGVYPPIPLVDPDDATLVHPVYGVFSQYVATAWSVYRAAGSLDPAQFFKVVLTEDQYHASGYGDDGWVYLKHTMRWPVRKFLAMHEVGHRFAELLTESAMMRSQQVYALWDDACPADIAEEGGDGRENDPDPGDGDPVHLGSTVHGIRSLEYGGSAVGEGFAHFFAAHAWNSAAQTDCRFKYYISVCATPSVPPTQCATVIDCESANVDQWGQLVFPRRVMRTRCTSPYAGYGSELDWFRAFWDIRTNGGGGSLDAIGVWLENASDDTWEEDTAYTVLNAQAQAEPAAIKDRWNATKADACPVDLDCNGL